MRIKDITSALEAFAPLRLQEEWDNSGLIIGCGEDEATGVMLGFDCTPELIDEAADKGCNLVVTHHPLIYKGVRRISSKEPVGAAIVRAIQRGVAVYAAHTTADKVLPGVSGAMARKLDLQDIQVLSQEEDGSVGFGCIGNLPVPMTGQEALAYVKEKFGVSVIRSTRPLETPIRRVAVMGGSGGSYSMLAMDKGAQLYITADVTYHYFFVPEGFMLMDIGHFESEVEIVDILLAQIRKNFPNFASYKSAVLDRSNPVHYFGL